MQAAGRLEEQIPFQKENLLAQPRFAAMVLQYAAGWCGIRRFELPPALFDSALRSGLQILQRNLFGLNWMGSLAYWKLVL